MNQTDFSDQTPKWDVSSIGARQHYLIPRTMYQEGKLGKFYTDFYLKASRKRFLQSKFFPNVSGRSDGVLPDRVVEDMPFSTVRWRFRSFMKAGKTKTELYNFYLRQGSEFATLVLRRMKNQNSSYLSRPLFFGFNSASLECLQYVKKNGGVGIVDQMDAAKVHEEIVLDEQTMWPQYKMRKEKVPSAYFERLRHEWELADRILVNSNWTKRALAIQGVPESKLDIIPLAYNSKSFQRGNRRFLKKGEPLKVLWLGTVSLGKGIQYLVEAFKFLKSITVKAEVVGPIDIAEKALHAFPEGVSVKGSIPRTEVPKKFVEHDVFVLPTLSDGFAITQIEAMAYGLPVITTDRCGEVVRDGIDGFIVPAGDALALAEKIDQLASQPELLSWMSRNAIERSKDFSEMKFQKRLISLLQDVEMSLA